MTAPTIERSPSTVRRLVGIGLWDAAIYSSTCATCHGATGLGSVGPRLAGRVAARYPDVADQIALVSNGRSGMPSFSDRLSETEIEAVVDYTRTDLAG